MPGPSRPQVLYLTHRVPYPPDKGDRIRNYHILAWLARRASVHLACLDDEGLDDAKAGMLKGLADRVAVIPLRRESRGMRAAWSFATGHTVSEGAFHSPRLGALLRSWARETRYHAVLASASSLVPYLRLPEFAGIPAVVDFVDVDSQKWLDYAAASRGPRAWLYRAEGERLRRLERDATTWARGVLLVSEAEANLFRHACDAPNVYTVPNGVDLENFQPDLEVAESDRTCVFVGALDYRPNIDGACWFCREAWPEIHRQRPGARLLLVGRQPVPAVRRLGAVPGVEVVGQVPDVRPYVGGCRRGGRAVAAGAGRPEQGARGPGDEQGDRRLAAVAGRAPGPGRRPGLDGLDGRGMGRVGGPADGRSGPEAPARCRRPPLRRGVAPLGSVPGAPGIHPGARERHGPGGRRPGGAGARSVIRGNSSRRPIEGLVGRSG